MKINFFIIAACVLIFSGIFLGAIFLIPWQGRNWGKVQFTNADSVTVIGEAQTQQKNQIATYNAGVSAVNDSKENAIKEVNDKTATLINSLKKFGIKAEDIKTQNLSVYQQEETYYDSGRQKSRPGQWRVDSSIQIILREVDRATDLSNLLAGSGATNIYGPNFSLDNTQKATNSLLEEAMKNAKEKAGIIAKASGKNLGKVITVTEGTQVSKIVPMALRDGSGGGAIEPGSNTVSTSVTVTYELE